MTDAAIPPAGRALSIWREKLAGVTPGEWYAEGREGYGGIPGVEIIAGDYTAFVAIGDVDELDAEANAAHIVRSDRLSRVLGDIRTPGFMAGAIGISLEEANAALSWLAAEAEREGR